VAYLNDYSLLTAKPVVYVINLSEDDYKRKKNKWLAKIHAWVTVSRCLSAGCR
jgi:obg-like ATPase 1